MKSSRITRLLTAMFMAGSVVAAFAAPAWQEGNTYSAGVVVSYNGHDYKALVSHTAYTGAGWNPASTPTLWQDLGVTSGTTPTPGPTATPTPTSKPATPTPAVTNTPTPVVTSTPTPVVGSCSVAAWSTTTAYNGGAQVSYNGRKYSAKWWTSGDIPSANTGDGKPWTDTGPCGVSVTPTPTSTPTPTISPTPSSVPFQPPAGVPANITSTFTEGPASSVSVTWTIDSAELGAPVNWFVMEGSLVVLSGTGPYTIGDDFVNNKAYYSTSGKLTNVSKGTHTYFVKVCNANFAKCGNGAAKTVQVTGSIVTPTPIVTVTPTPVTPTPNPGRKLLVGYLHASFANGSGYIRMADISDDWDVINLSFAEPTSSTSGQVAFKLCPSTECPNVESEADFIAAIKAKQAKGKKVLISIGGANGQVRLESAAARDAFVSSVSAIVDKYGLNGLDVDFEGHSLQLNAGDNDVANPTSPVIVNLISALKTLKAKYGANFMLTMAPETFFVQLGYQFYGGNCAGCDTRAGAYLPVIYALRNDLNWLQVQDYNSGPVTGLDNTYHSMGNADFHVAMTDMTLSGFKISGSSFQFPALRPDQVVIGIPANVNAGGGFVGPAEMTKALDCLMKGSNCGTYKPAKTYPGLGGLMTWSINWDKYNNFEFSKSYRAYFGQ
ncbi:Exochitinase 1 [Andreprevotia sp. IGB-42]|uniref:carbohydrate-binding protein n=1 Tax=Andreprevotia sp. IGB-42 TaxID=2497473 RepID=UPI00157F0045|nr:carbohydrate-binding protein [Andreprevotia sp. IGB-42]KAF0814560.1 Exochitinase 1 [Andreprevotia sp. IGB-42]